jgi:hypothetical protein
MSQCQLLLYGLLLLLNEAGYHSVSRYRQLLITPRAVAFAAMPCKVYVPRSFTLHLSSLLTPHQSCLLLHGSGELQCVLLRNHAVTFEEAQSVLLAASSILSGLWSLVSASAAAT